MLRRLSSGHVLVLVASIAGVIAACGSSSDSTFPNGGNGEEDAGNGNPPGSLVGDGGPNGNNGDGGILQPLRIDPPTLTVTIGGTLAAPTGGGAFTAHLGTDPAPVTAKWSVDDIRYGAIDATGNFVGKAIGGKTKVRARVGSMEALAEVEVKVVLSEDFASLTDDVKTKLRAGGTADANFKWLYPYDSTVFPRGLEAPTLQFAGAAPTAYRVHLKTSRMDVEGFYAGGTGAARVAVAEAWWKAVTLGTESTESIEVEVTKIAGNNVTGPKKVNWFVAPGSLRGSIYYNSYNSSLAVQKVNSTGAVLVVKPGKGLDVLLGGVTVPGNTSETKCVVCHSVSASGNRLVTGIGWSDQAPDSNNPIYSGSFNITPTGASLVQSTTEGRTYPFGALSPDGKYMVSSAVAGGIRGLSGTSPSKLIDVATGSVINESFFNGATTRNAVTPAFSPDGKLIAFSNGGNKELAIATFDAAASPPTFNGFTSVFTTAANKIGWPTFTPDGKAILAQEATRLDTETDSKGDLLWIDANTKKGTALNALNGKLTDGTYYLPYGETEDGHKNYEPTMLPVPVGGYYWVVFTSRRSLGNTIYKGQYSVNNNGGNGDSAYESGGSLKKGVRKKLWVAAIDVNRIADKDISHPAFYLEGQELDAGNMRGFWALDQCKADGSSCEGGDECCNGFCRNVEQSDGSVAAQCVPPPASCANESERCSVDADCCNAPTGTKCVNQLCTTPGPSSPK